MAQIQFGVTFYSSALLSMTYALAKLNSHWQENQTSSATTSSTISNELGTKIRTTFHRPVHDCDVQMLNMTSCPIPGLYLMDQAIPRDVCCILVKFVQDQLVAGRAGKLIGNTYTPIPPNFGWKKQSRELLQYGTYTHSNRNEAAATVAPLPDQLHRLISYLRKAKVFDDPITGREVNTLSCCTHFLVIQ